MTEENKSLRREAYRLLQAAKHTRDEDTRAALMALAKRYLELALADPNIGATSEAYSEP